MADDLVVFSWNLEKKSYGGLTSNADNVSRIVDNIANVVSTGDKGAETPFVGFLLEITGSDANVAKLCRAIEAEYRKKTNQDISVTGSSTDGAPHTRESTIVMSQGVEVTQSKLDVQEGIRTFLDKDKQNAERLHEERRTRRSHRAGYENHPYARPKPEHNRKLNRETDWFRNGAVADVKQGDHTYRIATVHAPGPDVSDKVTEVVDSIVDTARNSSVDILIGDLNRRGSMPTGFYEDLSKGWSTGTTFGKNEPDKLGKSRWDRVLAPKRRDFEIVSPDPTPVLRPADLGQRLSDHALIHAVVKPRVVPSFEFSTGPLQPFTTSGARPGGADLHALKSSQALIQPADPTLLYEAASDRKSSSDQLQKQAEDNPLTSPSTEPASNPLSPPSATSPLTEPPPGADTDATMGESEEAMEDMAAGGEEVAEAAEVVLL